MPRVSDRKVLTAFLAATLAVLASCASPKPPATAHFEAPADPCRKYDNPTDLGRCHLFTSPDGWQFIPEIGRTADLDAQIRCAPVRPDLELYAECIRRSTRSLAVALGAGVAELPAPDVAADDFEQLLREVEKLDAAPGDWTPPRAEPSAPADTSVARTTPSAPAASSTLTAPRVEPTAPAEPTFARTIPKSPPAAKPEQSVRPGCAENGSCYGDISSYTGRPKTVHVRGYYRKDGTYVRGHYRSRPRR